MKKICIILLVILSSQSFAFGLKRAPKMIARKIERKLYSVNTYYMNEAPLVLKQNADETAYYLKRIRLQFAPFVAFDVAFFELKLIPTFEFRWTRKNPTGWVNYRR